MPLISVNDPIIPLDTYNTTKALCEDIIKNSKLTWTIVRFGAIPPIESRGQPRLKLDDYVETIFGIPLDQKMEFIHPNDAALALVNAINNNKAYNKIFLGGGSPSCQLYQREFVFNVLKAMGLGILPENAFKKPESENDNREWFYTHCLDTQKAQDVLNFQRNSFNDYLSDIQKPSIPEKTLLYFLSPFITRYLVKKSPYSN